MTQVDVDACYEWQTSKLQVVFVVTITIKVYGCQDLFVCELEGNKLILMIGTLFLL